MTVASRPLRALSFSHVREEMAQRLYWLLEGTERSQDDIRPPPFYARPGPGSLQIL